MTVHFSQVRLPQLNGRISEATATVTPDIYIYIYIHTYTHTYIYIYIYIYTLEGRSQWPRGLTRGSVAAHLLVMLVRNPPGVLVSVSCECCVLSGTGD